MLYCKKCENSRKLHILFLIISLKLFKVQRCTIPHFKALDLLFWPLVWLLTLGSIIFSVWSKTSVHFFLLTLYVFRFLAFFAHFYWKIFENSLQGYVVLKEKWIMEEDVQMNVWLQQLMLEDFVAKKDLLMMEVCAKKNALIL